MSCEEDSVPWEVRLLQDYCENTDSLNALSYGKTSVLAGCWFVSQSSPALCLCGESLLEEGLVRQWVEYYVARVRSPTVWDALNKDQLKLVLEELSSSLSDTIFLTGHQLTLADILLYYGLHKYLAAMSFIQKASYPHVCRWFDQVQHCPRVRPFSLPLLVFHKNPRLLTSSVPS